MMMIKQMKITLNFSKVRYTNSPMKNLKRDHDQAFQQKVYVKVVMSVIKQIRVILNIL